MTLLFGICLLGISIGCVITAGLIVKDKYDSASMGFALGSLTCIVLGSLILYLGAVGTPAYKAMMPEHGTFTVLVTDGDGRYIVRIKHIKAGESFKVDSTNNPLIDEQGRSDVVAEQ